MYGTVPPEGFNVIPPLHIPKHVALLLVGFDASAPAGCVRFTVLIVIHPLVSVTVAKYCAAQSPVAMAVVCTGELFHEYIQGGPSPVGVTVAVPLHTPKQTILFPAAEREGPVELLNGIVSVTVHPLASLTVTVYKPAQSPVTEAVVCPLGAQLNV